MFSFYFDSHSKAMKIKEIHSRYSLILWVFTTFISINIFTNDFRAMLTLTKEDSIHLLEDLITHKTRISMSSKSYEFEQARNVKLFSNVF